MKRIGYLYEKVIDKENIYLAMQEACKTKRNHREVKEVYAKANQVIYYISKNFHISGNYRIKNHIDISSGKARVLTIPPYYPDQIIQHALTRVTEPYIMKKILPECCCSIKKRGMLYASKLIMKYVKNKDARYFVKFDVRKYFPSINHKILIQELSKIFKDKRIIASYSEIINSVEEGIPIGNFTSQSLANLYLTPLDRYIKQNLHIKYYARYMDDFIIIGNNKRYLQKCIILIKDFLFKKFKLITHDDEKVLEIENTPIDFCGFKHYKEYTTIRKRIWKRARRTLLRQLKYLNKRRSKRLMAYFGYIIHSNSFNIIKRYIGVINKSRLQLKTT